MPDLTLNAGEFALFWCDSSTADGPMHTSFRLSRGGEEIGIFDSQTNNYAPIDSLKYRYQQEDVSYGRKTDGIPPYWYYLASTPGNSNTSTVTAVYKIVDHPGLEWALFPNPVISDLTVIYGRTNLLRVTISDMLGRNLYTRELSSLSEANRITIDASVFRSPGIYLINISYQDETKQWLRLPVQKVVKMED